MVIFPLSFFLFSFFHFCLPPLPLLFFFSFSSCPYDKVSHHIPDWSETHCVAQSGLKLMTIFLPQPPTYWEPRQESPCPLLNFILRITLVVVIVFWYYDWTQSLVYDRLILYQWTSTSPLVFLEGVCICLKDNIAVQITVFLSEPFLKIWKLQLWWQSVIAPIPSMQATPAASLATGSLPFPWWSLSSDESFSPSNVYPAWNLQVQRRSQFQFPHFHEVALHRHFTHWGFLAFMTLGDQVRFPVHMYCSSLQDWRSLRLPTPFISSSSYPPHLLPPFIYFLTGCCIVQASLNLLRSQIWPRTPDLLASPSQGLELIPGIHYHAWLNGFSLLTSIFPSFPSFLSFLPSLPSLSSLHSLPSFPLLFLPSLLPSLPPAFLPSFLSLFGILRQGLIL